MPVDKRPRTMHEKERGLVPSRTFGKNDTAYGEYLDTLDPENRQDVQFALAGSQDTRFVAFLERLGTRRFGKKISLQTIAKSCGIELAEFNKWWQQASTQRAIAIAQTQSVTVMSDMAEDARSRNEACARCDGLGFVRADIGLPLDTPGYRPLELEAGVQWIRDCPKCKGTRMVREPGDEFSREKLLETSGLINKKGPGFQIIQNFGGASMASAVPRLDVMTIDVEPHGNGDNALWDEG